MRKLLSLFMLVCAAAHAQVYPVAIAQPLTQSTAAPFNLLTPFTIPSGMTVTNSGLFTGAGTISLSGAIDGTGSISLSGNIQAGVLTLSSIQATGGYSLFFQAGFENTISLSSGISSNTAYNLPVTGTNVSGDRMFIYTQLGTGNSTGATVNFYVPTPTTSGSLSQSVWFQPLTIGYAASTFSQDLYVGSYSGTSTFLDAVNLAGGLVSINSGTTSTLGGGTLTLSGNSNGSGALYLTSGSGSSAAGPLIVMQAQDNQSNLYATISQQTQGLLTIVANASSLSGTSYPGTVEIATAQWHGSYYPTATFAATGETVNGLVVGPGGSFGTGSLVVNGPATLTGTTTLGSGGTLSLAGTVTGSAGVIPSSLIAGGGTVTGLTLSESTAGVYGLVTGSTSNPVLTLSLDSNLVSLASTGNQTGYPRYVFGGLTFVGATVTYGYTGGSTFSPGFLTANGTTPFATTISIPVGSISSGLTGSFVLTAGGSTLTGTTTLGGTISLSTTSALLAGVGSISLSGAGTLNSLALTNSLSALTGSGSLTITGWLSSVATGSPGGDLADFTITSGTYAAPDPFYSGNVTSGGFQSWGPTVAFQGVTSNLSRLGPLQNAIYNVINNQSVSSVVILGDSVADFVWGAIGEDLQQAYGAVGTNGGVSAAGYPNFTGTESLSGTAVRTQTYTPPFTYSPEGHWVTLNATNDSVTYPNPVDIGGWQSNLIVFLVDTNSTSGTFTLQTSTNGTSFSTVTSSTVSWSRDGITWTSTNASQSGISASTSAPGLLATAVPVSLGQNYARVLDATGTVVSLPPGFLITGQQGFQVWQWWAPSIGGVANMATCPSTISTALMNVANYFTTSGNANGVVGMGQAVVHVVGAAGIASLSSAFGSGWPYLLMGIPPQGNAGVEVGGSGGSYYQDAKFASAAEANGYQYYDGFTQATFAQLNSYLDGYNVHPPATFNDLEAAQIENTMNLFSEINATVPRSVIGSSLVSTGTISLAPLDQFEPYPTSVGTTYSLQISARIGYNTVTFSENGQTIDFHENIGGFAGDLFTLSSSGGVTSFKPFAVVLNSGETATFSNGSGNMVETISETNSAAAATLILANTGASGKSVSLAMYGSTTPIPGVLVITGATASFGSGLVTTSLSITGASTLASLVATSISNSGTFNNSGATTLSGSTFVNSDTTTFSGVTSLSGGVNVTGVASFSNTATLNLLGTVTGSAGVIPSSLIAGGPYLPLTSFTLSSATDTAGGTDSATVVTPASLSASSPFWATQFPALAGLVTTTASGGLTVPDFYGDQLGTDSFSLGLRVTLPSWTTATTLISKVSANVGYQLSLAASGALILQVGNGSNLTTYSYSSTTTLGSLLAAGQPIAVAHEPLYLMVSVNPAGNITFAVNGQQLGATVAAGFSGQSVSNTAATTLPASCTLHNYWLANTAVTLAVMGDVARAGWGTHPEYANGGSENLYGSAYSSPRNTLLTGTASDLVATCYGTETTSLGSGVLSISATTGGFSVLNLGPINYSAPFCPIAGQQVVVAGTVSASSGSGYISVSDSSGSDAFTVFTMTNGAQSTAHTIGGGSNGWGGSYDLLTSGSLSCTVTNYTIKVIGVVTNLDLSVPLSQAGWQAHDSGPNANDGLLPAQPYFTYWTNPAAKGYIRGELTWSAANGAKSLLGQHPSLPYPGVVVTRVITHATTASSGTGLTVGDGSTANEYVAAASYSVGAKVQTLTSTPWPHSSAAVSYYDLTITPDSSSYTGIIDAVVEFDDTRVPPGL